MGLPRAQERRRAVKDLPLWPQHRLGARFLFGGAALEATDATGWPRLTKSVTLSLSRRAQFQSDALGRHVPERRPPQERRLPRARRPRPARRGRSTMARRRAMARDSHHLARRAFIHKGRRPQQPRGPPPRLRRTLQQTQRLLPLLREPRRRRHEEK